MPSQRHESALKGQKCFVSFEHVLRLSQRQSLEHAEKGFECFELQPWTHAWILHWFNVLIRGARSFAFAEQWQSHCLIEIRGLEDIHGRHA